MAKLVLFLALSAVIVACGMALYEVLCLCEYFDREREIDREWSRWARLLWVANLKQH